MMRVQCNENGPYTKAHSQIVCVSLLECKLAQRNIRIAAFKYVWDGNSADGNPMVGIYGLAFYFVKLLNQGGNSFSNFSLTFVKEVF